MPADERAACFAANYGRWVAELSSDLEPLLGPAAGSAAVIVTARTAELLTSGQDAWPSGRVTAESARLAALESDDV